MGLLDSLGYGNQGGYGGLLDMLMYQSPLNRPQEAAQPQYDAMGGFTGMTTGGAPDPFGAPPQMAQWAQQFAPKSPFTNAPASPVPFAPNAAPMNAAPALPPPQTVAPAPQVAQDLPTSTMNIGGQNGYQMPQFGSPPPQVAQSGATDFSAQSQAPSQPLPPAFGGGSYMDRLNNGGGLISSLFGDSGQQQNLAAQYHALRQALEANGESKQAAASKAMIAVSNPEAAKTIIPELFTSKTELKMVTDQFGGQHPYSWNAREQTFKPVGVNGETSGNSAPIGGGGYLAKGVSEYDPALPGQDYLKQFAPDVQSAIMAYKRGDSMPTGNARKGWAENVQKFAKAYGDKIGEPVNDQTFFEKKKLKTDLGASGNSTMGGILDNGESSFSHLADLGKSFSELGSASHNFPGGGAVAWGQNAIGSALGGSDTQGKIVAAKGNLAKYGAESTKFYAGTGGGVEERLAAQKLVPPESSSGEEQAAYMEKEKSLMLERLNTKFDHIRQTLGVEEGNKEIAKHMPGIEKNIASIDASIAKLRGVSGGLPSGWSVKVH